MTVLYLDDQPGPGSLVLRYLSGAGLVEVTEQLEAGTLEPADRGGDPYGDGTPSTEAEEQVRSPALPKKNKKFTPSDAFRLSTLQARRRTLLHHLSFGPERYPVRLESPDDGWLAGGGDIVVSVDWPAIESAIRRALASIDAEIERLTAPPSPSDAP